MDKTINATIRDKLGMRPAKPKTSTSHMPHKIFSFEILHINFRCCVEYSSTMAGTC
jgi:hypothetical protein